MLVRHLRGRFIAISALGLAALCASGAARAQDSHFFGRWVVSDDKPAYSAKGKLYKTIDVAPCDADFCGVSVSDAGACGQTLFRFLTIHANNDELIGHGLWGGVKKKLQIEFTAGDTANGPSFLLGLGEDDLDLTGREGSMPKFEANYKSAGAAKCVAGGQTS